MNLLIIGGAGHVGSILRPALEADHNCIYFDRKPVTGAEQRSIVGDVNDDDAIVAAMTDIDAVLYLAMGVGQGGKVAGGKGVANINAAFDVNVRGLYRALRYAMEADIRKFIYASSLSVYRSLKRNGHIDETIPPNAFDTYGLSKQLGERTCETAARMYPDATIISLRLMHPFDEQQWQQYDGAKPYRGYFPTGPNDLRRLFSAAIACDEPGSHIIQATGDTAGERYSHERARQTLGWQAVGE